MADINEIKEEVKRRGEDIIRSYPYFIVSKEQRKLYIRSVSGNCLRFDGDDVSSFREEDINQRYLIISWNERNHSGYRDCLHLPNPYLKKRLIIDKKNYTLIFSEEDSKDVDLFRINKIIEYDLYLLRKDYYLGWIKTSDTVYNSLSRKKMISLDEDTYYEICRNEYDHYITNIIYNNGNSVSVVTRVDHTIKIVRTFENVINWSRLSRIEGECELFFDYFIVKTLDSSILINLKTLKFLEISYQRILPTTFEFHSKYYLQKPAQKLVNMFKQYVCVDNIIYDQNLNAVLDLKADNRQDITLLDTIGNYIAILNNWGVNNEILILFVDSINGEFKCIDTRYTCYYDKFIDGIALKYKYDDRIRIPFHGFSDGYLISFNPKYLMFFVNTDQLNKDFKNRKTNYVIKEHYSIWDALDGDPEAYWNID